MRKVSVLAVILNWNGADHTLQCAANVLAQSGVTADVLIVDNGSDDDSVLRIRDAKLPVRLLQLESNQGFAAGMNAGLREALEGMYEYVWLLNSDAFAEKDCLRWLNEWMNREPALAMVTPRLMSQDGTEQHAGGTVDWNTGEPTVLLSSELINPIDDRYWLTGTAPLVRASSIASVGLFEPSFFAYWEDVDLSVRLRRAGGMLAAVPQASVLHIGSASSGRYSTFYNFLHTRNTWLFLERNARAGSSQDRWIRFVTAKMRLAAFYDLQGATTIVDGILAGVSAARRRRFGAPDATVEPARLERWIFKRRWLWEEDIASDQPGECRYRVNERPRPSAQPGETTTIIRTSNQTAVTFSVLENGYRCQICGQANGSVYQVREMMFGLRERFEYFECDECGSLQLTNPPDDMARYYPEGYYSFDPLPPPVPPAHTGLKKWIVQQRNAAVLLGGNWFWKRVADWRPPWSLEPLDPLFAHTTLKSLHAPILDVGCGNGRFLRRLVPLGFDNLLGVDPYLSEDLEFGPLRLEAKSLDQLNRTGFELILFDHSLEHIPDQIGTLKMVRELLGPTGVCVVRIPIAESEVWFKYGPDWFELDAPRHFCIHTPTSVRMAAARAGLEVFHLEYEGVSCAYWGSELYQRDIPYFSNGRAIDLETVFSRDELTAFESAAQQSNEAGSGGRGAFYLRRAAGGGGSAV